MARLTSTPEAPSKARTLSAQEEAIHSGRKMVHGTATDRCLRMYGALRNHGPPRVTLDRAILVTESFQETEGQSPVLRWAKALKFFAEKVPVTIFDDERVVGRPNTWFGYWGMVYPELDGGAMPAGVEMFRNAGAQLRREHGHCDRQFRRHEGRDCHNRVRAFPDDCHGAGGAGLGSAAGRTRRNDQDRGAGDRGRIARTTTLNKGP